jgi:hypothetical protein
MLMSVARSQMVGRWDFIGDMLVAMRHVNVNVTAIFGLPSSSIEYALITCRGSDEMKTVMRRWLPSRLE